MKKNNLIIAFVLLLMSHRAIACRCTFEYKWLTMREYNTRTVFVGKLLSARTPPENPLTIELKYQVVTNYRNTPVGDTITVFRPDGCSVTTESYQQLIGREEFVYPVYYLGDYDISICAEFQLAPPESVKGWTEKLPLAQEANRLDIVEKCNNVIHSWQLINEVKQRGNKMMKSYHANGVLEAKGKLKNSMPDGEWKYYDDKGRLLEVTNYKEGIKWGESRQYIYENDTLMQYNVFNYQNDRVIENFIYNPNDKKIGYIKNNFLHINNTSDRYKKDSLEITVLFYNELEEIVQKKQYKYDINKKYIIFVEKYAPNGNIIVKGTEKYSSVYENYVNCGLWYYYDENKNIIATEQYDENGVLIKQ